VLRISPAGGLGSVVHRTGAKTKGQFEVLRRVNHPDGKVVLVAIGLETDAGGNYRVRSAYLVSAKTVDDRRQAGRLKTLPRR
jgi:hypothetical protein